jgi:hypothetical protein
VANSVTWVLNEFLGELDECSRPGLKLLDLSSAGSVIELRVLRVFILIGLRNEATEGP